MKLFPRKIAFVSLALCVTQNLVQPVSAALYRTLTFPASDTITPVPYNGQHYQTLIDNGISYKIAFKYDMVGNTNGESENVQLPVISTNQFRSLGGSFHVEMDPRTISGTPGEKVFIDVCSGDNDSFAITNGGTSALKWWVFVPTNSELPSANQYVMMMEWWNNNAVASVGLSPATNAWSARIHTTNGVAEYDGAQFTRGVWHKFVAQATLDYYSTNGRLTVWYDDVKSLDITNVMIGIPSKRKNYVESGLYRGGQNTLTEVYIDDVMYGDSYNDVVNDPQVIPNGAYQLKNQYSKLVLDAWQSGTTNGTRVDQNDYQGAANQQWLLTCSNGTYQIVNSNAPSLAMEVHGNSMKSGAAIDLWYNSGFGKTNENWIIVPTSEGCYTVFNLNSQMVLENPGFSTNINTFLDQGAANGGANQNWQFAPIP